MKKPPPSPTPPRDGSGTACHVLVCFVETFEECHGLVVISWGAGIPGETQPEFSLLTGRAPSPATGRELVQGATGVLEGIRFHSGGSGYSSRLQGEPPLSKQPLRGSYSQGLLHPRWAARKTSAKSVPSASVPTASLGVCPTYISAVNSMDDWRICRFPSPRYARNDPPPTDGRGMPVGVYPPKLYRGQDNCPAFWKL